MLNICSATNKQSRVTVTLINYGFPLKDGNRKVEMTLDSNSSVGILRRIFHGETDFNIF